MPAFVSSQKAIRFLTPASPHRKYIEIIEDYWYKYSSAMYWLRRRGIQGRSEGCS